MPRRPPTHKPARRSQPRPAWQKAHGKARETGRPWRRKREHVLARDNHLCQPCLKLGVLTVATDVDHIIPVGEGGTSHTSNLQSICDRCHRCKTALEAKRARARGGVGGG